MNVCIYVFSIIQCHDLNINDLFIFNLILKLSE